MKYTLASLLFFTSFFCRAQQHDLNYYIQQASQSSPLIKGYQNQILQNQLDSVILRASLHAQVNFLSNDLYAPVVHGWGYDEAITNGAQLSGLAQVSRNFLQKGNIAAQFQSIGLQSRALRDTIQLTIRDLTKTITDQYITAYGDQLTMNYSKELYDLLKNEEEALKKLAESSVIKQTEFLAFDVTMQQQELTYLQAQIQFTADFLTLNYLAGINDTTLQTLAEPRLLDNLSPDLYNSVFYQRFTTDSLRIVNERRLIDYSYRPTIGTYADAGYNSSLQETPYKNFGFSVGVNLKIPIYDGHQKKYKMQKLDIQEQTRTTNRDFYMRQYMQQIAQLNIQLHAIDELFSKIQRQVTYTKTLIEAYGKLLQTGDMKVTDLVTAITNYLNAQNMFRQNLIARLKIMSQINYYNQ